MSFDQATQHNHPGFVAAQAPTPNALAALDQLQLAVDGLERELNALDKKLAPVCSMPIVLDTADAPYPTVPGGPLVQNLVERTRKVEALRQAVIALSSRLDV